MDEHQYLIFVVEDDVGMRQALQRLLRTSGFRTELFEDAEAWLASGIARGADCLVLDVHLPGASGIEAYAGLGGGRPPAVFITSHDRQAVRDAATRAGGCAVLPKPFRGCDLLDAIGQAIRRGTGVDP
jgi:FixJ family two-component response regulator